jgi:hypothetical protein
MGLQKHTHEKITAMRCYIGLDALSFVKDLQDEFTSTHA